MVTTGNTTALGYLLGALSTALIIGLLRAARQEENENHAE